jgi:hypothetical protein
LFINWILDLNLKMFNFPQFIRNYAHLEEVARQIKPYLKQATYKDFSNFTFYHDGKQV